MKTTRFIKGLMFATLSLTVPAVAVAGGKKDLPPEEEDEVLEYKIPDPENIPKPSNGEGGGKGATLNLPPLEKELTPAKD